MNPPYSALAELLQVNPNERPGAPWQEALRRAVDGAAGLTAVDGATIITSDHQVLAFGAKIVRRLGAARVEQIIVTEPIAGASPIIMEPGQLGGLDTYPRRSSRTISGIRLRWWLRRMAGLRFSGGLRAKKWFTRIG